ncbi:Uncharacterised protein [Mycobacteroides abscessus]|nr:Uncharacterised protein [Mycobacteroides abscessus]
MSRPQPPPGTRNERTTSVPSGSPTSTTTTAAVSAAGARSPVGRPSRHRRSGWADDADDDRLRARSRRARVRFATVSAAATTTSCTTDSTAAVRRSRNCVVWIQISVSIVP